MYKNTVKLKKNYSVEKSEREKTSTLHDLKKKGIVLKSNI